MSLGQRIFIGVAAGIVVGIFFGEMTGWLDVIGDVYVGLLQMTVLPYVTVSLISKVGKLTAEQAKTLAGRAGLVLLALWLISLATVLIMPVSLPAWDAGTFFSATLVEQPKEFDFLGLYLPTNPFHSLANNIVPAVVVFSILLGAALITVKNKERLLEPLGVVSEALGGISNFVVKMSPYGTFALAAGAAGQLSPDKLARLSGYVSTYTVAVLLLTFVVLPGFAAALTPFRFRKILAGTRDALLTAFATGKLFAVLPMVITGARDLLVSHGTPEEEAQTTADVYVPLGYPFPNAGKVLSILFLPFAAWFIGVPLEISQYPMLLTVGLFAFFGSPVAAIPFLLDMLRLPNDLLPLFLISGIWCARIGDVLGAMHLAVFTLICSAWNQGLMRIHPVRLGKWFAASVVFGCIALYINQAAIEVTLAGQGSSRDRVANMGLMGEHAEIVVLDKPEPNPHKLEGGENYLGRIRRTKEIRVGFIDKAPPFSHPNDAGERVGFDVDLIQILARDLGAKLVLVPTTRAGIKDGIENDHFDLALGGIPSTIKNFDLYHESRSYLDLHAALLIPDHAAKDLRSYEAAKRRAAREPLRIAYEKGGIFVEARRPIPGLETIEIESTSAYVRGETDADALLTSAEAAAFIAMAFPEYSVVIPEGIAVNVPVVFAVRPARELERMIDTWVQIKEDDGTVRRLYEFWVLGKVSQEKHKPRWSVIRDVLGWVD
ncbi:MAG: cation:dicarboxylate symporter family transporter [Planctomycetota bacterium]|jgi:Na+/H+-dicarboxylate symporter/ABC-type amino acid transport substrate-binding protein